MNYELKNLNLSSTTLIFIMETIGKNRNPTQPNLITMVPRNPEIPKSRNPEIRGTQNENLTTDRFLSVTDRK